MIQLPIKLISIIFASFLSIAGLYSMIDIPPPSVTALSWDKKFTEKYQSTTFGYKYRNFFASPENNSTLEITINDNWWHWTYHNVWKKATTTGKFSSSNIEFGYSTKDNDKALNKVCDKVYKSQTSKVTSAGTGNDEYKEEDVWKFCSPLGSKPKTIQVKSSENYSSNTNAIGKKKESVLISLDSENQKFWMIRNLEAQESEIGFTIDDSHKYFKAQVNANKSIRDICAAAYKLEGNGTSEDSKPTEDETVKYCSLESPDLPSKPQK